MRMPDFTEYEVKILTSPDNTGTLECFYCNASPLPSAQLIVLSIVLVLPYFFLILVLIIFKTAQGSLLVSLNRSLLGDQPSQLRSSYLLTGTVPVVCLDQGQCKRHPYPGNFHMFLLLINFLDNSLTRDAELWR